MARKKTVKKEVAEKISLVKQAYNAAKAWLVIVTGKHNQPF